MQRHIAITALAMLFLLCICSAQNSTDISAYIFDADGHVVPDTFVFANYQELVNNTIYDRDISGFSDVSGSWSGTITPSKNVSISNFASIEAYLPYWSSDVQRLKLFGDAGGEISANFTAPLNFETYRVQVINNESLPMGGINVHIFRPMLFSKKTNSNGIAQFRFPKGYPVFGQAEFGDFVQYFSFNISDKNSSNFITIPFMAKTSVPAVSNYSFNWTVQVLDSNGEAIKNSPFALSIERHNITYWSDSMGFLRFFEIPQDNITLYWQLYGYTFSKNFTMSQNPPQIFMSEKLLKIQTPSIAHLGESCYRVEVNITDPRKGVMKQVVARSEDGNQTLALTLEQNQSFDQSHVAFYRIFCVVEDTGFDIVASSPYENATLKIQLLRSASDAPEGEEEIMMPSGAKEQIEESRKIELVVILIEVLAILLIIYLFLRFKNTALYILQSIVRFAYLFLRSTILKNKED